MLTQDKTITLPSYWDKVYNGGNMDAKVDSSNTTRPVRTFDRFDAVVKHVEGPKVLDIGSGHARICQRLKHKNPSWEVVASDQCVEAKKIAKYSPYLIFSAYKIPVYNVYFDTIIITQAMEYLEFPERFMNEAKRVAKKLVCTIPLGEMEKWSQLRIYDEENFIKWIGEWGTVEVNENYGELLLVKIKFSKREP
jgi:ubiquinone/menaquinone biosynthesis C-methylase UbiE